MTQSGMKMVVRLGDSEENPASPRESARRDRRTEKARKRKISLQNKIRAVRLARLARNRRRKKRSVPRQKLAEKAADNAKDAAGFTLKKVATAPLKAIAVGVGWSMLAKDLGDLVIFGAQLDRRFNRGTSGRLEELEDSHTQFGNLLLEAQTNAQALAFLESNSGLLQAIGQEGKMNASIGYVVDEVKRLAAIRVQGADLIARDPHFDSADSLLDKLMNLYRNKDLKGKADQAIDAIKSRGHGKMTSPR